VGQPVLDSRRFDFAAWVADFDAAQAGGSAFDAAANLRAHEQTVEPGTAHGGELALRYALQGTLSAMEPEAAQAVLADPDFAIRPQAVGAQPAPAADAAAPPATPLNIALDAPAATFNDDGASGQEASAARTAPDAEGRDALSQWYAAGMQPNICRFDPALAFLDEAGEEIETRAAFDDAWRLERAWREAHGRLQRAPELGDEGIAAAFSAASLRLTLPHHRTDPARVASASTAGAGLQTFRGLSDGFNVLG
jgi:hypothetical protein